MYYKHPDTQHLGTDATGPDAHDASHNAHKLTVKRREVFAFAQEMVVFAHCNFPLAWIPRVCAL
jgi:hypothetical protein